MTKLDHPKVAADPRRANAAQKIEWVRSYPMEHVTAVTLHGRRLTTP
jgi:hypothetical protein